MKQFKSIPVKLKNYAPITIKEPYKPDIKEFADTDEFTRYFRGNEDAFREVSDDPEKPPHFLTANKLNRTYKIPGYIHLAHRSCGRVSEPTEGKILLWAGENPAKFIA